MEDKISFKKDQHHSAETNLEASKSKEAALEKELEELCKKFKCKGKREVSPEPHWSMMICKFHRWESATDSDVTENTSLSRSSWKQWRHDYATPELLTSKIVPFPNIAPMDIGPGHILPLAGFTKVGEQGPDPPLPTAHVNTIILMISTLSQWGRGDPHTSIT